jgi:Flp pilus assembly protein TadG
MRPHRLALRRHVRGLAAVELALIAPFFLFLMVGTAELGRALYEYNTLTKAVRNGAQYLARHAVTAAGIVNTAPYETAAKNLVVYGDPTGNSSALLKDMKTDDVTVTALTVAPSATPNYINVTATYKFQPAFAIIPSFGTGNDVTPPGTFSASVTMRGL